MVITQIPPARLDVQPEPLVVTSASSRRPSLCARSSLPIIPPGRFPQLNGDTHLFKADRPLADPSSTTGVIHNTLAVPNLQRIVVQGSTNSPAEWLKITVDPRTPGMFSWSNVAYCSDPLNSVCN